MGDGDEIEPALDRIVEVGFGHGLLGTREYLVRSRLLVDRAAHLVVHRRHRAQISDDAVEVSRGQDLIKTAWHDSGKAVAGGPGAFLQRRLDLGVSPTADASVAIGRNVGRRDIERRFVETQSRRIGHRNFKARRERQGMPMK